MIKEIEINNFKSIDNLKLELGRINLLIGENGCGKSNILEGIALGSAGCINKLDNEFLVSRGIRLANPHLMRAAFDDENKTKSINIVFYDNNGKIGCNIQNDNEEYSSWYNKAFIPSQLIADILEDDSKRKEVASKFKLDEKNIIKVLEMALKGISSIENIWENFVIYSPQNAALRTFEKEGQIEPLGIKGEGLFKLLKIMKSRGQLDTINNYLKCISWFETFDIPENLFMNEKYIKIKDRYLDSEIAFFDQNSSNEGFLFLLFYFCLFISKDTPQFFAIDNIETSLNPKLCSNLMERLVSIAKEKDKQVIITTHNPAVLDGLNLDDDEQRLFVVYRNRAGHTKIRRILKPKVEGKNSTRMSIAFLNGYIGGLPKGF